MKEDNTRKQFEKWALSEGLEILKDESGSYFYESTDGYWSAWKASRESLVIDLPVDLNNWGDGYYQQAIDEVKAELERQGVVWK